MGIFSSKPSYSAYSPYSQPSTFSSMWPFSSSSSSSYSSYGTSSGSSWGSTLGIIVGGLFLVFAGIAFYDYLRKRQGLSTILPTSSSSSDMTPTPVDGKTKTTISASEAPVGAGADYGMQFWMYIKDWDYKFSQEKQVIKRIGSSGSADESPRITLHPTDNSLNVRVAIYPNSTSSGAAATPTSDSNGDSFTCTVENVPLQSWFAVSVTVFQRNLDIYINGRLVKSCVLPGIPKPVVGDVVIGDAGGFSGSLCGFHSHTSMIGPDDAKAFYNAGTSCQAPVSTTATNTVDPNSTFVTIFGYTFRFSTLDKAGKEISSYTF